MKKLKILPILTALVLAACLALTACAANDNDANGSGSSGNPPTVSSGENEDNSSSSAATPQGTYYTVTFDSQGGSAVESQRVREGNPADAPDAPTRGTDVFQGWYKSADDGAELWDFSTDRVNSNVTLYAKWQSAEVQEPTATLVYELNEAGTGYAVTGDDGQSERIIIPETHEGLPVVQIADDAFAYSRRPSAITYVSIPNSVTEIGRNAFYSRQDDLKTVQIGRESRLQRIGANAFSGARSLESFYFPASLTDVGDSAFNNCGSLEEIIVASENEVYFSANGHLVERASGKLIRGGSNPEIPNGVLIIGEAAFSYGKQTTLIIPASVVSIENRAVSGSAVESITFLGTEEQWNEILNNSSSTWNFQKRNLPVSFKNGGEDETEARGTGPQGAPSVKSAYDGSRVITAIKAFYSI